MLHPHQIWRGGEGGPLFCSRKSGPAPSSPSESTYSVLCTVYQLSIFIFILFFSTLYRTQEKRSCFLNKWRGWDSLRVLEGIGRATWLSADSIQKRKKNRMKDTVKLPIVRHVSCCWRRCRYVEAKSCYNYSKTANLHYRGQHIV